MQPSVNKTALSATLHCLTGCAIGEILGLVIGQSLGWHGGLTIVMATVMAFFFGYGLSILPLIKARVALWTALGVVLAADTLSIVTMELVDNAVMAVVPGAMGAGLNNPIFWLSMALSMAAAFIAAFPVNRYLLLHGKGHALMHEYHDHKTGGHD